MKSVKIVLIVILCAVVAFFATVLGFFLINRGNSTFFFRSNVNITSNYNLVLDETVDAADIENIVIDYNMNSNEVFIMESDDDKIHVKEYWTMEKDDNLISTVQVSGGKLVIRGKKRNNSTWGINFHVGFYTEVYIPSKEYNSISVATISGDTAVKMDLVLKESLQAASTSGEISCESVKAKDIILSSVSGDIRVRNAEGDVKAAATSGEIYVMGSVGNRVVSAVSGDISVEGMEGVFDIGTTSGEIYVRDAKGNGRASSVSGDVTIALSDMTGNLNVNTTSGEVILRVPEETSFEMDFNSTSGDINTFFDDVLSFDKKHHNAKGTYGSNADKQINVSTVSGDLSISKY